MRKDILRFFHYGIPIQIIYMSQSGKFSKRRVTIQKVSSDFFQAYCFTRNAQRTFIIDNVLAISPIPTKERNVI